MLRKKTNIILIIAICFVAIFTCAFIGLQNNFKLADAFVASPVEPETTVDGFTFKITDLRPDQSTEKLHIAPSDKSAKGAKADESQGEFIAANVKAWTTPNADAIDHYNFVTFTVGAESRHKVAGTKAKLFINYYNEPSNYSNSGSNASPHYVEGTFDDKGAVSFHVDKMFTLLTLVAKYNPDAPVGPDVGPVSPQTGYDFGETE